MIQVRQHWQYNIYDLAEIHKQVGVFIMQIVPTGIASKNPVRACRHIGHMVLAAIFL